MSLLDFSQLHSFSMMKNLIVDKESYYWILNSLCTIFNLAFSSELASQQIAGDFSLDSLESTLKKFHLESSSCFISFSTLKQQSFPLVAWTKSTSEEHSNSSKLLAQPLIVLAIAEELLLVASPDKSAPYQVASTEFEQLYSGYATHVRTISNVSDIDEPSKTNAFGFRWFLPELAKFKSLWREILLASLIIQCIGLATPLFTQAVIDKVIVHRTQSTLIVLIVGMAVFMLFSAGLTWLRQYLVLHTGNRIDAKLGIEVFAHLFKLPPLYFQFRSTGTIAARLHGVEVIREFIASAAITLALDLPFLIIFLSIMLMYSVPLTLMVLGILSIVVLLSILVAPRFQAKLQEQFKMGARNQAFVTEYLVGLETVKSLQLEPQITAKYKDYLASYLASGFDTKQLANTYNATSNLLEQIMTLAILGVGAYTVMHDPHFSIGMLIAFQMFSGRLSQPMLRMVGLWQQFQQAKLSMARLGDLMNAPVEPYSIVPSRAGTKRGLVQIEQVAFRYSETGPYLYENLNMSIQPGQITAIMGPSGCGKSTLAKLLQSFYQPCAGRILIDGVDIRHLSANELRSHFGIVPQETTLFSGTIYNNLQMAKPDASFDQIVAACRMAEIHDVIEALPQGYQTQIGERGAGLSGGQKQRVAIARALLKRPSILVFDEATSALDTATAESFARTINKLRGKVTMLFITHGVPKGLQVDAVFRLGRKGVQQLVRTTVANTAAGQPDGSNQAAPITAANAAMVGAAGG